MPLVAGLVTIGENLAMPVQAPLAQTGTGITERVDTDFIIPTKLDIGNNRTNKY